MSFCNHCLGRSFIFKEQHSQSGSICITQEKLPISKSVPSRRTLKAKGSFFPCSFLGSRRHRHLWSTIGLPQQRYSWCFVCKTLPCPRNLLVHKPTTVLSCIFSSPPLKDSLLLFSPLLFSPLPPFPSSPFLSFPSPPLLSFPLFFPSLPFSLSFSSHLIVFLLLSCSSSLCSLPFWFMAFCFVQWRHI